MTTKLQDPRYPEKALDTVCKVLQPAPPSRTSVHTFKNPSTAAPPAPAPRSASFSLPPACSPGRLPGYSGNPHRPCPAPSLLTSQHRGRVPGGRPGLPPPLPHAPAGPQRPCRGPGAARLTHIGSSNLASQDLRASTSSMSMVQGRRARAAAPPKARRGSLLAAASRSLTAPGALTHRAS